MHSRSILSKYGKPVSTGNSCDLLIQNASVVIPKVGIVHDTNIMIEDGRIKELRNDSSNISAVDKINVNGKYVLPGIIDPHVHYGVFTPINEAAKSESRSASVGGVTTMIRMLRLYESYKNSIAEQLQASIGSHYIDYSIHASILRKEQVDDIPYLKDIGINSAKIYMNLGADLDHILMDVKPDTYSLKDGTVNMTDELILSIIESAYSANSTVLVHAEDPHVCSQLINLKRNGHDGLRTWSECRPSSSEASSIAKAAGFARVCGADLYFVHIGSSGAIDAILEQKQKGGSNLYVETCPHYLTHTVDYTDLKGKVVPPIRSKSDLQSLWSALRNGIIDTIGTDHVASRLDMKLGKGDIWSAMSGFPGIATMLPVLLSKGVNENRISIERLVEVTSYNTSRIFGMYPKKGTIQVGSDADLTIVDMDIEKKVTPELLQSYSDYTIYDGWKLQGWPIFTIVRGKIVMENGQVSDDVMGHGQFISRPVQL